MLFPDARTGLASLWGAVQGAPMRAMEPEEWDWTPAVARAWDLKDELAARRLAWFGHYFRGKASFIAPSLLPSMLRLTPRPRLSPEAREALDRLRRVGPMTTLRLRMSLRLGGARGKARFQKVLLQLYRALLICNVDADDSETRWHAAVVGPLDRHFPEAVRGARSICKTEAVARVRAAAPALPPHRRAALFGDVAI
jgi:hypothetical protein